MLLESMNYLHWMVVFYGGSRVIVPSAGCKRILDDLHETHQGASRMKARAQMVVWWPGLDKSIEEIVSNCSACQASRPLPPPAPLHPWSIPQKAWSRLHMDYAGPLHDHMFLWMLSLNG